MGFICILGYNMMDMNELIAKMPYRSPEFTVIEFGSEQGFCVSGELEDGGTLPSYEMEEW